MFSTGRQQMQAQLERTQTQPERTQLWLITHWHCKRHSNARAIEAWGARTEEIATDTEEATSSTRADLAVPIEDNAHN